MKYLKTYENLNQEPVIIYYENGQKKSEIYYLNNKIHREDGPAYQCWFENGQKEYEEYYLNNKIHREDGPAIQDWYSNGKQASEYYYLNGKCHREDGPASFLMSIGGNTDKNYFLNDMEYSREEWLEELKEIGSIHYEEELLKYEADKYNL